MQGTTQRHCVGGGTSAMMTNHPQGHRSPSEYAVSTQTTPALRTDARRTTFYARFFGATKRARFV